jgi:hypothetical protein
MRTALSNASHELQTIVTNAQLIEWVEWTFTEAPPNKNTELSTLIEVLKQPTKSRSRLSLLEIAITHEPTPTPTPTPTPAPAPTPSPKPAPARPGSMPSAPIATRSRLRPWLLFLLLITVVFAMWRLGYAPPDVSELLDRIPR